MSVFQAEGPGGALGNQKEPQADKSEADTVNAGALLQTEAESLDEKKIGTAGIRVDLSRIGGQP